MKLTLDTNCLINLFDSASSSRTSVNALSELMRAALANEVSIAITTRVERDMLNDRNEGRRAEMLDRLAMFPVIGSVLRAGVSPVGRDSVGGGSQAIEAEVRGILAPGLGQGSRRVSNAINDVDHIVGHVINERDIFITDDRGILKNAEALQRSVGAVVMSPQDCIDHLAGRSDRRSRAVHSSTALVQTRRLPPTVERSTEVERCDVEDPDKALAAMVEDLKGSELQKTAGDRAMCDRVLSAIAHIVDHEIVLHLSNVYVRVQSNYGPIPCGSHSEIGISRRDNPQIAFMRNLDVVIDGRELTIMIDGEPVARMDSNAPDLGGSTAKTIRANYLSGLQQLRRYE